ncbi:hypothetical protein AC578_1815 [Pseudocercospora eumusae]|uniref:Fe2OG dioxygenase domain-containing protein n=1 Tax=Pseudocercospora eumusae TaxID=321146 RepID=A0A139HK35_9PEZI|nr:hypothetical protein AC578_1815 [Pseudocercospora eumusae]
MAYIPNFISEEEQKNILDKARSIPFAPHKIKENRYLANEIQKLPPQQIPSNQWINLAHRRLQPLPSRLTNTNTLLTSTALPSWLQTPLIERISALEIFSNAPHGINHCLINEYLPGQGIMPHEDGAAYYPAVATVSLGGTLVLDVIEKGEKKRSWRILQEPRSLLVTTGEAYTETLHGIAEVEEDRELGSETVANWGLLGGEKSRIEECGGVNVRTTRISLTFRDVKKVSALGKKIFGKPKT